MIKRRQVLIGGSALALSATGATPFEVGNMGSVDDYNAVVVKLW